MNHRIISLLTLIVTALLFFTLGYFAKSSNQTFGNSLRDTPLHDPRSVRIGLIAPLTGPFADWGRTIKEGMELALEDTQHQFTVDFQDSACDPKQTVDIAHKLFNIDEIALIIGPGCVTGLKAIIPLAEESRALLFSTGLLDTETLEDTTVVINWASQISTEGQYIARYLADQGTENVAIIHGTNTFGQEYGKTLPSFLQNQSVQVSSIHPTDLAVTDFNTVITRLLTEHPDAIFIHQAEAQIGLFAKQLRERGSNVPLFSYYGAESESVMNAGGSALEGLVYTYPVNSAQDSMKKKIFEQRYADIFGADATPSATSYFVYDGMMILDRALDECKEDDTACIARFFNMLGSYSGISGDMIFHENGSITRPFGIKTVTGNESQWVTKRIELDK